MTINIVADPNAWVASQAGSLSWCHVLVFDIYVIVASPSHIHLLIAHCAAHSYICNICIAVVERLSLEDVSMNGELKSSNHSPGMFN